MSDLVVSIDFGLSQKQRRLVVETYGGSIPHLKSHQYSGPLRNVNINSISEFDNLTADDFELLKSYLNGPNNIQTKKQRFILARQSIAGLSNLAQLGCLFYRQNKGPMFKVEEILLDAATNNGIALDGMVIWGNGTKIGINVIDNEIVDSPLLMTAIAYVDLKNSEHKLQLLFEYDGRRVYNGIESDKGFDLNDLRDYAFETQSVTCITSNGWKRRDSHSYIYVGTSFQNDLLRLIDSGIKVFTRDEKRVLKGTYQGINVSYGIDWFDIEGNVAVADKTIDISELIDLRERGSNWVEIGESVLALPRELMSPQLTRAKGAKGVTLPKGQIALAMEIAHCLGKGKIENIDKLFNYKDIVLHIDKNIESLLRSYQRIGVMWLLSLRRNHFGGCLADDMGLGKTLQIIAYLSDESISDGCSMIVVPKTLIINWKREIERFWPAAKVYVYHGLERLSSEAVDAQIVITTYGTLLNDINLFQGVSFKNLIMDEAQYIKNPRSKAYYAMDAINADTKIILTGTPIENNLREYWSLMRLVNPDVFAGVNPFHRGDNTDKALNWLRDATSPFLLRRLKADVMPDLPEKIEQTVYCAMEDDQRRIYDRLLLSVRKEIERESNQFEMKDNSIMLKGLLYLQEACCHPRLLNENLNRERCDTSVKLELTMEMLSELRKSGHKTVVFSRFTRMLRIIEQRLIREHYGYAYLDGSTSHRMDVVDEFENDNVSVFLISLKAGGTGLNLVSADTVIIYDPWWNPAAEVQAEDRVFRYGQTKDVIVYRIIVENTIEEKVQNLQMEKKRLYDQILDGHENPTVITTNEMRKLLFG